MAETRVCAECDKTVSEWTDVKAYFKIPYDVPERGQLVANMHSTYSVCPDCLANFETRVWSDGYTFIDGAIYVDKD